MAHAPHLRTRAREWRRERKWTLDVIADRLQLPKSTVYYWIKDIPIARTSRQTAAQKRGTRAGRLKAQERRRKVYEAALSRAAKDLANDPELRDFVVMYLGEGFRRSRYTASLGNQNPRIVQLAHRTFRNYASSESKLQYRVMLYPDHNPEVVLDYWARLLDISPKDISTFSKTNTTLLGTSRTRRSPHGVLTVSVSDVVFRAKLQAWMDHVQAEWDQAASGVGVAPPDGLKVATKRLLDI